MFAFQLQTEHKQAEEDSKLQPLYTIQKAFVSTPMEKLALKHEATTMAECNTKGCCFK